MKKVLSNLIFVLLVFGFLILSVNGAVQVFSKYDNTLVIHKNNTIEVTKSLTIKNVYTVGIVPGQIEFKVGKSTDGELNTLEISNLKVVDSYGSVIPSQIRKTKDYSVIVLDVYYPLLPGFEYSFDITYTLDYNPGGIFFKNLQVPLRESTIPIEKGYFSVELPTNYYFTYVNSDEGEGQVNKNTAKWDIKNDIPKSISFEYSYLPVKVGNYRGSYVFWIVINLILILILLFEIRKEVKRVKAQYGG